MRAIIPWFGGGAEAFRTGGHHGRFHRLPGGGRSPAKPVSDGLFLSNREFIANEGKKQVLLIALRYLSCRSVCDFNGIEQG
jgi:hypothetical protein